MFKNVTSLEEKPSITFVQEITKYLWLKSEIKHYFFSDGYAQACIYTRNPFTAKPYDLLVEAGEQEELIIDLQCDEGAQEKLKGFTLTNFWLNVSSSYSTLAKNAITQLLVFTIIKAYRKKVATRFVFLTTWECGQGFFTFATIKSKTRNHLVNSKPICDIL